MTTQFSPLTNILCSYVSKYSMTQRNVLYFKNKYYNNTTAKKLPKINIMSINIIFYILGVNRLTPEYTWARQTWGDFNETSKLWSGAVAKVSKFMNMPLKKDVKNS